jgi:hypothetical protein
MHSTIYGKWSRDRKSWDQKVFSGGWKNNHEIKSGFLMKSKVSIIFDNFDQEVKTLIMRSKVQKYKNGTIIEFQSHEQFVSCKCNHEIKNIWIY